MTGGSADGSAGSGPDAAGKPAPDAPGGSRGTGAASGGAGGADSVRAGYRRSTRSPRGEARRRELLERVSDDLAANGLVGFSLRRAARAAGTTHKVLLYHFDGTEDLLRQATLRLRARRIDNALAAAFGDPPPGTGAPPAGLAGRVRAIWAVLMDAGTGLRVLDQAIGLALYDPARYGDLVRDASEQYLPTLVSLCPPHWPERRRLEVAQMVLAALRGFLVHWLTSGDTTGVDAGLAALTRALEREEAAPA
jgi:AcrR family transcriptional regulator